jgi:phospholipid/cholesterol/gamma-HCH transport system substrate-binding protein
MTSDIDDLTGDPKFRNSLRNLIKALGNLFGTAQELEKQTSIAQQLAPLEAAFQDPQTVKRISENPSLQWEISNSLPKLQPLVLPSPDESALSTSPPSEVFFTERDRF